ncbi:amidohydrolase family protein [Daejeonella sp. H1SJ63]|uniref:amidohydrolase family protein n=1 Tax=Daejeonella sp. H1SJ63 TaxID=3034145 RepID=UPI0023EBA191|nr:amidohydrolase family protein [Daejeonella sp. H1SJ63]
MLRYLSADYILPVSADPIKDGVVVIDESGTIIDLLDAEESSGLSDKTEKFAGLIVPGFVNAHCHLELSHMKAQLPKGLGLPSFIRSVITQRAADQDQVLKAMEEFDQVMFDNGIVAVGDISNTNLSKPVKSRSKIYYHTFAELLGFDPQRAEAAFQRALDLKNELAPLPSSIVPHAPYSVSKELFLILKQYSDNQDNLITMHNQECAQENEFFMSKEGEFIDFYRFLNQDISFFEPQIKTSLQSVLSLLPDKQKIMLVHNTFTDADDIHFAISSGREIYWCFCPNANLYIEGRLPDINLFQHSGLKMTIGTDSLASNEKLCIFSEIQTIKAHFPELAFGTLLQWATLNGACFLGVEDRFGSIEKGKTPGLNLIRNVKGTEISPDSELFRLV